jgi:hypothetical protein
MPQPAPSPAVELPAAGIWQIDPSHAEVGFVGRHFGLTKIRGRFTGAAGTVVIADDPPTSSVEVTIDMRSVSSGDQSRDDHLALGRLLRRRSPPDGDLPLDRCPRRRHIRHGRRRADDQGSHPPGSAAGRLPRPRHRPMGQRPSHVQRHLAHQSRGLGPDMEHVARSRWPARVEGDHHRDRGRADPPTGMSRTAADEPDVRQ